MAKRSLSNKRVLLTGASSGIGWHLAQQLVAAGAVVLASARRETRLAELQCLCDSVADAHQQKMPSPTTAPSSTHRPLTYLAGDIAIDAFRHQLVSCVADRWGAVDIVINNAGVGSLGLFEDSSPEILRQVMEVNFFAPAEMMRLTFPLLKQGRQPILVNISSVLGHRAVPLKSEYCASKFALHGLSDAVRAEWKAEGVDVTLISPSTTDSEFFEHAIADSSGRNWKGKRAMRPEKVAAAALTAIRSGKQELILTLGGKSLVWLDRIWPNAANEAVRRWG